jgi:hypothetical protein
MFIINQDWVNALIGGLIIGIAVSLMLLWNGRVTGISGIVNGLLNYTKGEMSWRILFISGLVIGGFTLKLINPHFLKSTLISTESQNQILETSNAIVNHISFHPILTIVSGLLVGFGTVLGSGCTSGHGVCGISRLSPRSLVATLSFIIAGAVAVFFLRLLGFFI